MWFMYGRMVLLMRMTCINVAFFSLLLSLVTKQAYRIRAEGVTRIILINRRISDFLDFDEKVRAREKPRRVSSRKRCFC